MITWNIDLKDLLQGRKRIETLDGSVRQGKITGVQTREIRLLDRVIKTPTAIELDGDTMDTVDWNIIKQIDRA